MYKVADLSRVWVDFEAYEQDLKWLQVGDSIRFDVGAYPGRKFYGKITYINPVVDAETRIATVRTEVVNPDKKLKPQMFADGVVKAEPAKKDKQIVVPKSAVMWTGPRSVVFVQQPDTEKPRYRYKEVELGADLGDQYVIKEGLEQGEKVVTNGNFMIDAEAQLQSKASMMNQKVADQNIDHDHSDAHKTMNMQDFEEQTPKAFQKQLGNFIVPYLTLKDALVNGKASKASNAAGQALQALEKVDMKLLEGKAHMAWMEQLKPMKEALKPIQKHEDIEKQRDHFIPLSTNTVKAVQAFGVKGADTLYIQHCPMANDNKGADWISNKEKIRNPYYGDQMLTCGRVTETISE